MNVGLILGVLALCTGMDCEGNVPADLANPMQHALGATVRGQGSVSLDPPGDLYDPDSVVSLTATAFDGWVFDHWEGDLAGENPAGILTMDMTRNVIAVFIEVPADAVFLDGTVVGSGSVFIEPPGDPFGTSFRYLRGTEVTLTAIPDPGWFFVGWFGDVESLDLSVNLALSEDVFVIAFFENAIPPPPPPIIGAIVVANDGQFLGVISANRTDPDSLANPFGTYGNPFSRLSIWNEFGQYGSDFGFSSPYNDFSSTPPSIILNGVFDSSLTTNSFIAPRIDPNDLAIAIGRPEVVRP